MNGCPKFYIRLSYVEFLTGTRDERVRTGEKVRFGELGALGAVIAGMLEKDERPERDHD